MSCPKRCELEDPQLDGEDLYLPGTDFSKKRTERVYGPSRNEWID